MTSKIKAYIEEVRQEWRHVHWPTRQEAVRLTLVVVGISLGLAAVLGAFDYLFTLAILNSFSP